MNKKERLNAAVNFFLMLLSGYAAYKLLVLLINVESKLSSGGYFIIPGKEWIISILDVALTLAILYLLHNTAHCFVSFGYYISNKKSRFFKSLATKLFSLKEENEELEVWLPHEEENKN